MRIIATTFFLLIVGLVFGQKSVREMAANEGQYSVGFDHFLTFDSTRTYRRAGDWTNENIPRPVPVSIWFPAEEIEASTEPIKVLDYLRILKEEEEWEYLPDEWVLKWFDYKDSPENQDHLKGNTRAFVGVEPRTGPFPVVVYAPSFRASSIENFALAEYLASHGFIVISSPSRGADTRFLEGASPKDLETQARDIEFLIKEVSKNPNADAGRLAAMGFSFGGMSNVLAQMSDERIKAVISLDGTVKYQFGTLQKSPFFDLKKADVPFIHMAQKEIPEEVLKEEGIDPGMNTDFEYYEKLSQSAAYRLQFHHLTHPYFSSLGVLFNERDPRQDKSDAEIMKSYVLMQQYTLSFLNAYLNQDTAALTFLRSSPSANGIPDAVLSSEFKMADQKEFTFNDFNELAKKCGYTDLSALWESIKTEYPKLELPQGNLNNLGLQLLFNPATTQSGINVLGFATELYPESANLFDSLAEAYLFAGERELAAENFEKSLKLDSQNQNAIDRLDQLRKR